jgi:hypothetical protein
LKIRAQTDSKIAQDKVKKQLIQNYNERVQLNICRGGHMASNKRGYILKARQRWTLLSQRGEIGPWIKVDLITALYYNRYSRKYLDCSPLIFFSSGLVAEK